MSVVQSYVETSISIPISSTTNLTGRLNPETTLVCLEQPTLASSKNRNILNRVHLNLIELQRLYQSLDVLLNLAGHQFNFEHHQWLTVAPVLTFLTLSISKALFSTSKGKRDLHLKWIYAVSKKNNMQQSFFYSGTTLSDLVVVLFSIGYLALSLQTNYHSGVLALLSACVGYIIPGPKAWTKKFIRTLIVSFRSWARVVVVKLIWCLK